MIPALGHISSGKIYVTQPKEEALKNLNKLSDDRQVNRLDLFVNHKSKDSHHGGTAVVKLDSTLGKLGLLIEGVPSEVNVSVTEVTGELSLASYVLHDSSLKESDEGDDLDNSGVRDGAKCGPTARDGAEGGSGEINVSWKVDSGTVYDLSEESKLGDTSVLELYVTEAVEFLLVGIIEESERVEESKRWLGSKLRLEGVKSGGGLGNLGWGESGGGGGKGGGDNKLHFDVFY